MMFIVFAVLALALVVGGLGHRRLSLCLIFLFFVLAVKQFLWEIYSPEYGFRMPWIQVHLMNDNAVSGSTV